MIYLLRKLLLVDISAAELMRVKHILDAHGIPYDVKTTTGENIFSRRYNARASAGLQESYDKVSRQSYVYYLYVRRRDYARAKELAGIR